MKRGDLVVIVLSGDYGKPRPALVVRSDLFPVLPSVAVLPLTSELHEEHLVRITVEPTEENGLRQRSQFMVDKPSTIPRGRLGPRMGQVDRKALRTVDAALGRFLGLAQPV